MGHLSVIVNQTKSAVFAAILKPEDASIDTYICEQNIKGGFHFKLLGVQSGETVRPYNPTEPFAPS